MAASILEWCKDMYETLEELDQNRCRGTLVLGVSFSTKNDDIHASIIDLIERLGSLDIEPIANCAHDVADFIRLTHNYWIEVLEWHATRLLDFLVAPKWPLVEVRHVASKAAAAIAVSESVQDRPVTGKNVTDGRRSYRGRLYYEAPSREHLEFKTFIMRGGEIGFSAVSITADYGAWQVSGTAKRQADGSFLAKGVLATTQGVKGDNPWDMRFNVHVNSDEALSVSGVVKARDGEIAFEGELEWADGAPATTE